VSRLVARRYDSFCAGRASAWATVSQMEPVHNARHAAPVHGDGGRRRARHRYADKAQPVGFNPVGQIVGRMNEVRPVKEVIY
jgi:hypothetical protein